jgi:hypothetical protein
MTAYPDGSTDDTSEKIDAISNALFLGGEMYVVVCRDCEAFFWTRMLQTGSKWRELCPSCLADHL